ncbi:MAG TPA: hypothetical protein VM890_15940 [Longimicrobium sp.]|jgi:uncharacterized BrkB/YihY/UPF0761 family membrane protein|nr:hypothetical protein [Longimicrobium sp.]
MDIVQLVVVGMVLTILATLVLATVSYGAFKVRERRVPGAARAGDAAPLFFERVRFVPRDAAGK